MGASANQAAFLPLYSVVNKAKKETTNRNIQVPNKDTFEPSQLCAPAVNPAINENSGVVGTSSVQGGDMPKVPPMFKGPLTLPRGTAVDGYTSIRDIEETIYECAGYDTLDNIEPLMDSDDCVVDAIDPEYDTVITPPDRTPSEGVAKSGAYSLRVSQRGGAWSLREHIYQDIHEVEDIIAEDGQEDMPYARHSLL